MRLMRPTDAALLHRGVSLGRVAGVIGPVTTPDRRDGVRRRAGRILRPVRHKKHCPALRTKTAGAPVRHIPRPLTAEVLLLRSRVVKDGPPVRQTHDEAALRFSAAGKTAAPPSDTGL